MNKKFWRIIISFWFASIIAGSCTYFYISYSQKQERKQFIADFNYDYVTVEQEKSVPPTTAQFDAQFIKEIQQVIEKLNEYEANISTMIHNNDYQNSNVEYMLSAYQQSKFYMERFSNIEITNSSLVETIEFEKIADVTFNYLRASSFYYIISAKKLKKSTDFLEQQHKTAQEALSTSKSQLLAVIELYSEHK